MGPTPRRSADDWVDAASARFREAGLPAVRVEVVARDLGATKGSFYWHFADRAALVTAVVARWEAEQTDRFIALAEEPDGTGAAPDPRQRLARLFAHVAADPLRGEDRLYLDAAAEGVGEAVARVSRRRTAFVADALEALGLEPAVAHRRATLVLGAVLGLDQLRHVGLAGDPRERRELAALLLELATAPRAGG